MKKRVVSIELLRILAMMMVVMLHYLGKGKLLPDVTGEMSLNGYVAWGLESLSIVAVNVYMLISGYFLVESGFKPARLVELICQVLFYTILVPVVLVCCGIISAEGFTIYHLLLNILPVQMNQYWFITAYVIMYLFSPILSAAAKSMKQEQLKVTIIALMLFFSVSKTILPVELAIDNRGNDCIWFLCVFLVAAYIRLYGIPFFMEKKEIPESALAGSGKKEMPKDTLASSEKKGMPKDTLASSEKKGMPKDALASSEKKGMPKDALASSEKKEMPENALVCSGKKGASKYGRRGLLCYLAGCVGIFCLTFAVRAVYLKTGSLDHFIKIGFDYNHVLNLLAAVGLFYAFLHWKLPQEGMAAKIILKAAPYSLGVYLFHEQLQIRTLWPQWLGASAEGNVLVFVIRCIVSVVLVYVVGTLVDAVRAWIFKVVKQVIAKLVL